MMSSTGTHVRRRFTKSAFSILWLFFSVFVSTAYGFTVTIPGIAMVGRVTNDLCGGGMQSINISGTEQRCVVQNINATEMYINSPNGGYFTAKGESTFAFSTPYNNTGSSIHSANLVLWLCPGQNHCSTRAGSPVVWASTPTVAGIGAPLQDLHFSTGTWRGSLSGKQGICFTLNFGASNEYRPGDTTGGGWCSDALPLSSVPAECTVTSGSTMDVLFGLIDRDNLLSSVPSVGGYGEQSSNVIVDCTMDASLSEFHISNLIPGGDGAGHGLIRTDVDGLGIGVRIQSQIMNETGILRAPITVGHNMFKFSLVPINVANKKLPAVKFNSFSVMTLDLP